MTVLEKFSDSLLGASNASSSSVLDAAALHVFDTLGALDAGRGIEETVALAAALADGDGAAPSLASRIIAAVATVRATEIDDIHLAGCVTPSSVVVPVALALAASLPALSARRGDDLLRACVAGYEAMGRFGRAIDGTALLGRGLWPTPLCAGIGAAATAGVLLGLNPAALVHALGLAGATATGINTRGAAPTGRWLAVATGAANGALATLAAARAMTCDPALFDGRWSAATGIALDPDILGAPFDGAFEISTLSFKPWCAARQTMTATAAFRDLLAESRVDVESLREVRVDVPQAHRAMIDRPRLAADRQESFADLRYAFGLVAFAPDGLFDVQRDSLCRDPRIDALAGKIRITADAAPARPYPARWPARVTMIAADGTPHTREAVTAPGDPGTDFGWDAVAAKRARITGGSSVVAARDRAICRALAAGGAVGPVLAASGFGGDAAAPSRRRVRKWLRWSMISMPRPRS